MDECKRERGVDFLRETAASFFAYSLYHSNVLPRYCDAVVERSGGDDFFKIFSGDT